MDVRRSMESDSVVEMSALGRSAQLGDLYDIRRDRFCISRAGGGRLSLATCPNVLPRGLFRSRPSIDVSHTFISDDDNRNNSLETRFSILAVHPAQLKLSILAGLFEPEAFAECLQDVESRDGPMSTSAAQAALKAALFCQVTSSEHLLDFSSFPQNLDAQGSRQLQGMETEMAAPATHVVSGIVFGATVVASILSRPLANFSRHQPGGQQQVDGSSPALAAAVQRQAKARLDGKLMALVAALKAQSPSDGCLTAEHRSWHPGGGERVGAGYRRGLNVQLTSLETSLHSSICSRDQDWDTLSSRSRRDVSSTAIPTSLPLDGNPVIADSGAGAAAGEEIVDDITIRVFSDLVWETGARPSSPSLPELKALLERVSRIRGYSRGLAVPIAIRLTPLVDFIRWHQQRLSPAPLDEAMQLLRRLPLPLVHPDDNSICETVRLFQEMEDLQKDVDAISRELALAVRAHGESVVIKQEIDVFDRERGKIKAGKEYLRRYVAEATVQIRSCPATPSNLLTRALHKLRERCGIQERREQLAGVLRAIKQAADHLTSLKRNGVRFYRAYNEELAIGQILAHHKGQSVYIFVHDCVQGRGESWERNVNLLNSLVSIECERLRLRQQSRGQRERGGGGGVGGPRRLPSGLKRSGAAPTDATAVGPAGEGSRCFFYFLEVSDSSPESFFYVQVPEETGSAAGSFTGSAATSSASSIATRMTATEGTTSRDTMSSVHSSCRSDCGRGGSTNNGPVVGPITAAEGGGEGGGGGGGGGAGRPQTTIKFFSAGCLLVDDVAAHMARVGRLCIVRSNEMELDHHVSFTSNVDRPATTAFVRTICPGSDSRRRLPTERDRLCEGCARDWFCERCAAQMEYCSDGYVYCDCGRAPVRSLSFLCRDPRHTTSQYVRFDRPEADLAEQVGAVMSNDQEVNILLLGESGVGKSTFINGFANYLRHRAMDDAAEDLVALIPSKFTWCEDSDNFRSLEVTVGERQDGGNEAAATGRGDSSTQSCKAYVFGYGDYKVRLIDTQGIGDTRGIERDRINFDNLLRFLRCHRSLHGICILLKPNCSRLNVMFRFCVMELLSHLHSSAKGNIAFVFTNARSTFYKPGETMPVLTEMLGNIRKSPPHVDIQVDRSTMYCLDSDSFRFLAALKHGVRFTDKDLKDYRKSWEISSAECHRLMDFILRRHPHKVQDTVALNQARRRVLQLAEPLGEINGQLQLHLKLMAAKRMEIQSTTTKLSDMKNKPRQQFAYVDHQDAREPMIVCTSPGCTDTIMLDGQAQYHYRTICHVPCHESTGSFDVVSEQGLRSCSVMRSDATCGQCYCKWTAHMRTTKMTSVVNGFREDPAVQASIASVEQTESQLKQQLSELQERAKELDQERRDVSTASRQFAVFLGRHAILPYNDALLEYLSHLIHQAKSDDQSGYGEAEEKQEDHSDAVERLQRLQQLEETYENEARILSDALTATNSSDLMDDAMLSAEGSQRLLERLYRLRINGQRISRAVAESEERALDRDFSSGMLPRWRLQHG
ncbi:hypothetical protein CBR_g34768 [Chara braunii]|uniref:DUF8206 domain-containing protein n=1 Tax=Chara braunii TaxID=69332 RepID=A0A388LJJ3_CHABU|nr:hypothetical protein CBR_g34768 [Chara braunii]|eukprot:GBG82392.1 hypothetical protein CBR_g34768 [Chara braunii]